MKVLLDTHLLLWAAGIPEKLSRKARTLIENRDNELFFSAASLWEVAIKRQIGRSDFQVDERVLRRALLDYDYVELPITGEHTVTLGSLPSIHKDPLDRILVAQATCEGLTLATSDPQIAKYPGAILKV